MVVNKKNIEKLELILKRYSYRELSDIMGYGSPANVCYWLKTRRMSKKAARHLDVVLKDKKFMSTLEGV
jgi:hypothetical protein